MLCPLHPSFPAFGGICNATVQKLRSHITAELQIPPNVDIYRIASGFALAMTRVNGF
jgi:hypothetical protein